MVTRPTDVMSPDYMARLAIYDAQQDVINTNRTAHDMYRDHVVPNWISKNLQNRNLGLPVEPPPTPPQEIVVLDNGMETRRSFSDLQVPSLPPDIDTGTHGQIAATTGIPADRIDNMQKAIDRLTAMVLVLNGKLDQILAGRTL